MVMVAWAAIYGLWSLRVVYGGSWLGIVGRSLLLAFSYFLLLLASTSGLLIAAVLLR